MNKRVYSLLEYILVYSMFVLLSSISKTNKNIQQMASEFVSSAVLNVIHLIIYLFIFNSTTCNKREICLVLGYEAEH